MTQGNLLDFVIQWHLTERCNLRCSHCYQTGRGNDELSLFEIKEAVDEIVEMFETWSRDYLLSMSPSLNITGGEPFLRSDLPEILSMIRDKGFETFLLSNGTLITDKSAKLLSKLGITGVQISIEGPEAIHENIRGQDSFAASIRGVNKLLDAGVPVALNVTLSEMNAGCFPELLSLSLALGVQKLGFSRLVPTGRGKGMLEQVLNKEKIKNIYTEIFDLDRGNLEIVTGDPIVSQMHTPCGEDAGSVAIGGCAAGLSGLTFLPDGTIVPCRRLFIPIGNIRHDSLRDIWVTSDVLNDLRDRSKYSGKCGACERWALCRGCRAIAYAHSLAQGQEDFLAPDPQCFVNS